MAKHEKRESGGGRFAKGNLCDGCGRPAGIDHMTDEEVCGSSDGPGFFLCERVRCPARAAEFQARSVEARRAHYAATRERGAPPTASIVFETRGYEFAHGRRPSGYGSWAFDVGQGPEFMPASTYSEAKKAFSKLLLARVSVASASTIHVEVCS